MHTRSGDEGKRPLIATADNAEDHVDDLERGNRFDGTVEVLGEEVPEDLGPEEAVEACCDLI